MNAESAGLRACEYSYVGVFLRMWAGVVGFASVHLTL